MIPSWHDWMFQDGIHINWKATFGDNLSILYIICHIFSEEYLRAKLMRSASDEALGIKSDDLEDDVDSIRSPFYKPRTPLRYPLSPQSPPSDESSYQVIKPHKPQKINPLILSCV